MSTCARPVSATQLCLMAIPWSLVRMLENFLSVSFFSFFFFCSISLGSALLGKDLVTTFIEIGVGQSTGLTIRNLWVNH